MEELVQKICSKCKILKNVKDFNKRKKGKGGLCEICKYCDKEYKSKYYLKNKDKINKRNKEYYIKHCKDEQYGRREYNKKYREENKKKISENKKEYAKANKEKIKINNTRYRENNKEKLRKYRKEYNYTLNYKISKILRSRQWKAFSANNSQKHISTIDLLGCSIEFFKKYLESKFTKGMSWENRGNNGWHIDHIRPCSSFDLSDPEQQKICFHYTNQQPLWATAAIAIKYGESSDYIGNLEKQDNF